MHFRDEYAVKRVVPRFEDLHTLFGVCEEKGELVILSYLGMCHVDLVPEFESGGHGSWDSGLSSFLT